MVKKGMLGAALAIVTLFAFGTAAQAQYGGGETVTVVQGETISVTGDGCAPGATVTFAIIAGSFNADAGTATAGSDGSFTATITVPLATPVGAATATATCDGPGGETVTKVLNLNVIAASTPTPINGGALPRTGSDNTQTLLGVGAGFLLLGGTLAVGARRTRRSTVAA